MLYSQLETKTYAELESYTYEELENSSSFDVGVFIKIKNGQVCNNLIFYPQIESGTTKTAFEQYKEARLELQLEPLRSDITGTIKDEIVMRNGLYGVLRRIHNFMPDEHWAFDVDTQTYITFTHYTSIGIVPSSACICTHLPYAEVTNDRTVAIDAISVVDLNTLKICYDSAFSTIKTESDLQTWLTTNNIQVQCQLKVPIFEPFDPATQTILRNFSTEFAPSICYVDDVVTTTMDYEILNTN